MKHQAFGFFCRLNDGSEVLTDFMKRFSYILEMKQILYQSYSDFMF